MAPELHALTSLLTAGRDLSPEEAAAAAAALADAALPDDAKEAFLLALARKGETAAEVAGFARTYRGLARQVDLGDLPARAIDIVGTGGDKSGSVNVSTMAALVVAGAGVPVCKHGNRSASSRCGTADVLEALGARIDLPADRVARCVEKTGFGFVFAPAFHPAFKHVGPVRRELGVPTVFNLLGPMANPAPVAAMLVGVADPRRMATMAAVLAARTKRSIVVHGHGGLDELSLGGANRVLVAADGTVQPESVIDANDIGLSRADNDALRGGDPAHNAAVVRGVVSGEIRGPIRDVVVLNAAAALLAAGAVTNLVAGATLAVASLDSGTARVTLDAFVAETTLNS